MYPVLRHVILSNGKIFLPELISMSSIFQTIPKIGKLPTYSFMVKFGYVANSILDRKVIINLLAKVGSITNFAFF